MFYLPIPNQSIRLLNIQYDEKFTNFTPEHFIKFKALSVHVCPCNSCFSGVEISGIEHISHTWILNVKPTRKQTRAVALNGYGTWRVLGGFLRIQMQQIPYTERKAGSGNEAARAQSRNERITWPFSVSWPSVSQSSKSEAGLDLMRAPPFKAPHIYTRDTPRPHSPFPVSARDARARQSRHSGIGSKPGVHSKKPWANSDRALVNWMLVR